MEKNQADFMQLRNAKIEKIDLFTERCKECQEVFTSVTKADKHVRRISCKSEEGDRHGPLKTTVCDICNLKFATRRKFLNHNLQQHKDKDIECVDCHVFFKRRGDWQRHKKDQHGETPKIVECPYCSFSSTRDIFILS